MTHDDPEPVDDPLTGQHDIDALLDGEAVDKESLRTVLAAAAARDYLLDALMLRQLTRETGPHLLPPAKPHQVIGRDVRWIAAALALMTTAAGGYAYGLHTRPATPDAPLAATTAPPPAPEPTHVIRFEPGVNWSNPTWSR
jgi:hypothetical protein